jgi:hypothetical protein
MLDAIKRLTTESTPVPRHVLTKESVQRGRNRCEGTNKLAKVRGKAQERSQVADIR